MEKSPNCSHTKSGQSNKRRPLSYHGISLQSAVLKLYTSVLNQRLKSWLESNNILSQLQNGFRPHRSCQDHMILLYNIVLNRKLLSEDTFLCYIDFRKVFDSVNKKSPLAKASSIWYKRPLPEHSEKYVLRIRICSRAKWLLHTLGFRPKWCQTGLSTIPFTVQPIHK